MINYNYCDRCNLKTDTIYRTKNNEYLCPICAENYPDEEIFIEE